MSDQNGRSSAWQDWQLSAHVLGELDEPLVSEIESAADRDPQLRAELIDIKQALLQIQEVFEQEATSVSTDKQPAQRLETIFSRAAQEVPMDESDLKDLERVGADKSVQRLQSVVDAGKGESLRRRSRLKWLGLTAMVASLFLAVFLMFLDENAWVPSSSSLSRTQLVEMREFLAESSLDEAVAIDPSGLEQKLEGLESDGLDVSFKHADVARSTGSGLGGTSDGKVELEVEVSAGKILQQDSVSASVAYGGEGGGFGLATRPAVGNGGDSAGGGYGGGGYGGGGVADASGAVIAGTNRSLSVVDRGKANDAMGPGGISPGSMGMGGLGGTGNGIGGKSTSYRADVGRSDGAGLAAIPSSRPRQSASSGSGYTIKESDELDTQVRRGTLPVRESDATPDMQGLAKKLGANHPSVVQLADESPDGYSRVSTLGEGPAATQLTINEALIEKNFEAKEQASVDGDRYLVESELLRRRTLRGRSERFGDGGDQFAPIHENRFLPVDGHPLSTFSIDVDTASYAKSRQLLLENRRLPPADAVRIEEFVNYFDYEYSGPQDGDPFGANLAIAACPWRPEHKLVRIALQAEKLDVRNRPKANIVFLLDVSGSMDESNKLPLVKESMRMLAEQLGENDRVAMVVYAGAAGCVLEGTRGDQQQRILAAIDRLNAGGSTNGGQGIQLAYDLARDNFVPGGINRVILCTDGDFNVGVTSTQALVELVEENAKSKIFLTVLGFGMGNTNDAMMEQISNRGNGVYGFVDNRREAHRQMVKQLAGNLVTVAKDVKIQVEFNPQRVESYRLLGYENRLMAARDFNDDTKDAGEIGAGHRVTAFYEVVPAGGASAVDNNGIDELRYRTSTIEKPQDIRGEGEAVSQEWLAVKLRYKQPEGDTSRKLVFPLERDPVALEEADRDFRWAASMVEFGMLLRNSRYRGTSKWSNLLERATSAAGVNPSAARQECLEMIRTAENLSR